MNETVAEDAFTANGNFASFHEALLDLVVRMNRPRFQALILERAGVTLDRALFPVLSRVGRLGPIGVVDLAELLDIGHPTVSKQLNQLETLGLITRKPSVRDQRVREAVMTAEGQRMLSAINKGRQRLIDEMLAAWTDEERQQLTRSVSQLAETVRAFTEHSAAAADPATNRIRSGGRTRQRGGAPQPRPGRHDGHCDPA